MPKWTIGVISAAFALIIGFACGALLTKPDVVLTDRSIKTAQASEEEMRKAKEQLNNRIKEIIQAGRDTEIRLESLREQYKILEEKLVRVNEKNDALQEQIEELKATNARLLESILK